MLRCGQTWHPSGIERFIESFPTSTRVIHVMADEGPAFLKAMGNPAGSQSLACELVGTELAAWFGLPTFEFSLIEVPSDLDLPFADFVGVAEPGPAFISKQEQVVTWGGGEALLKRMSNLKDISKLILFDTWIMNSDRYPPEGSILTPNLDNYLFVNEGRGKYRLLASDHTHCFTDGDLWEDVMNAEMIVDDAIYGFHPEFMPYVRREAVIDGVARLRQIDETAASEIVNLVPQAWGITASRREA